MLAWGLTVLVFGWGARGLELLLLTVPDAPGNMVDVAAQFLFVVGVVVGLVADMLVARTTWRHVAPRTSR